MDSLKLFDWRSKDTFCPDPGWREMVTEKTIRIVMEIFPYVGVDDLKFEDSLDQIKKKLSEFKRIHEGNRVA